MRDPYAVLLQKEKEIQRVRQEIETLRSVLPLLDDNSASGGESTSDGNNKWPIEVTRSR